jgi:hypothetical protein
MSSSSYYSIVNLVIQRGAVTDGYPTMTSTWGMSGKGFTDDWGYDGWYDEIWTFHASKNMSGTIVQQAGAGSAKGDTVWTRNGNNFHTSAYCQYYRNKYHPVTLGRYLNDVQLDVLHNSSSNRRRATYTFKPPRKPSISEATYDPSTHRITFTITAAEDDGKYERYDTYYRVTQQSSSNISGSNYHTEKNTTNWTSFTSASKEVTFDYPYAESLTTGQWVRITVYAYSRGLAGDSETVSRAYIYARPPKASITSIVKSGLTSTDYVTVRLTTNATSTAPVDSVKLQRLRSSSIATAAAAGLAGGWADVTGAVDNGNATGLTDMVGDALPTVKTHTWYRVVSAHGAFTANSVPVEAACLYRAKSPQQDDAVVFSSIQSGDDGSSIIARLAWNDDDSNTTQVSWSEHEDAWESTEQPRTYNVSWEESSHPSGFTHSATVSLRGLEEGVEYYVRARRALISDDTTSYGDWCYPASASYPITPTTAPEDVVLTVPSVVERGDGIDCSWTYSGSEQTAWQICYDDGGARKELLSGAGPSGAAVVPAASVDGMDSVKLCVGLTTGGDWSYSEYVPVTIDVAPTLSMSVSSTLTAQPASIAFTCSSSRTNVTAYITSLGVSSGTPSGEALQAEGDVVWSDVIAPDWTESNGVWTATVGAPSGLKLYEGGNYLVTAIATDTKTLLSSEWVDAEFSVAWAHQAYIPSDASTVTVDGLAASITPATPVIPEGVDDEVAETDVCDVYRSTPDGAYLIARDVPFGKTVTDRFAPYSDGGELNYILCTRTVDGDIAWSDYTYELRHLSLRIDFGEESVELPYDIAKSDSWDKDFELREHLDGTRAGYWNAGATRKSTLSTNVIKVESAEQRMLLSDLAKHAGACFVRTPDGCAFPADVQVDSYGVAYSSGVLPVSISATEVAMTDAFRIAPDDWAPETNTTTTGA